MVFLVRKLFRAWDRLILLDLSLRWWWTSYSKQLLTCNVQKNNTNIRVKTRCATSNFKAASSCSHLTCEARTWSPQISIAADNVHVFIFDESSASPSPLKMFPTCAYANITIEITQNFRKAVCPAFVAVSREGACVYLDSVVSVVWDGLKCVTKLKSATTPAFNHTDETWKWLWYSFM